MVFRSLAPAASQARATLPIGAALNDVERAFATDRYTVLYRCWRAGRRAGAGDRFVAGHWEGDGVRRREDRTAGVAARLQPPGADGGRRLRHRQRPIFSRAGSHPALLCATEIPVTTESFVLAVTRAVRPQCGSNPAARSRRTPPPRRRTAVRSTSSGRRRSAS